MTTDAGIVVLTHLWWFEGIPDDPLADDPDLLLHHHERVLEVANRIIPGTRPRPRRALKPARRDKGRTARHDAGGR